MIKTKIGGIYTNLKNYSEEGKDISFVTNKKIYEPMPVQPVKIEVKTVD